MQKIKSVFALIGLVLVVLLIGFFVGRGCKKVEVVEVPVVNNDSILKLNKVLQDTVVSLNRSFFARIFELEKELSEERKKPPKVVYVTDTIESFVLSWEWIAKVHKTAEQCSVWTFKIDSLFMRGSMDDILSDMKSVDMLTGFDTVCGRLKLYVYDMKERNFTLTSKNEGLFCKVEKERNIPVRILLSLGVKYSVITNDYGIDTFSDTWNDPGRFFISAVTGVKVSRVGFEVGADVNRTTFEFCGIIKYFVR